MKTIVPPASWLLLIFVPLCLWAGDSDPLPHRLSLDGTWQIVFDPGNEGREAGWYRPEVFAGLEQSRPIEVPSCWEEIEKDYEGVAFYRRTFEVPETFHGRIVYLRFGAVNYLTEVWLNGEVVGSHEGGFTPFEFRIDTLLDPGGRNTLTLRVVGPIILQDKMVDGVGPLETPQWRGGITGGIWQSVALIATAETRVRDVFIQPSIEDDTATFRLELENTAERNRVVSLETMIRTVTDPPEIVVRKVQEVRLRPGVSESEETLTLPGARRWSPQDPHLYRAEVRLAGSDVWSSRFGMREFTISNEQFYLNGEPIYLKATFLEGLYPNRIAYPDSREMAEREIRLAKEAGFNMIRPWRRPPAPMWLDLADEMGILVVGAPVLECMRLPLSTPYLPSMVEREIRQTVLRDRNRACVVKWELFNELHRPILKQMMRPMALLTRELDPTRLILDESGGWAYGARIYLPHDFEPTRFNDIHTYPGPFIKRHIYDGFLSIGLTEEEKKARGLSARTPGRNVVPGLMSFVSELGYGSLPNLVENNRRFRAEGNPLTPAYRYHRRLAEEQRRALEESGFAYLYPDLESFCLEQQAIHGAANRRMIEAVRANPKVNGYCIHALTAGDWILGAGLVDLWRQPKMPVYEATRAANQPRILSLRMTPRNIYAARGSELEVIGINELGDLDATLSVRVLSPAGEVVFTREMGISWEKGVSQLFSLRLDTEDLRGTHRLSAIVTGADGSELARSTLEFDVFGEEELKLPQASVALLDLGGELQRFFENREWGVMKFEPDTAPSTPVFVDQVNPETEQDRHRFSALLDFVERGGIAVYISGVGRIYKVQSTNEVQSETVPFKAKVQAARGLWTCIPHLVRDHPIFEGLPVDGMMRDIYENVWAGQTLLGLDVEPVVASIGYEWFSWDHELHYSGPGDSWWGADVAVVPHGEGDLIVSQLRIVENLGKDPVADKLLGNLMRYAATRARRSAVDPRVP